MNKDKTIESLTRYVTTTMIAFLLVSFFALFTLNVSFLNPIGRVIKDFSMTDYYYQVMENGVPDTSRLVTIVDMTEQTLRRNIRETIDNIEKCKPKTVGVDVVFEGLKEDAIGDMLIEEAASIYNNIVFSYRLQDYDEIRKEYAYEVHSFFTDSTSVIEGYTNFDRYLYGGIKRKLSFNRRIKGELKPSFITQVINNYAGQEVIDMHNDDWEINYTPIYFHVVRYDSIGYCKDLLTDRIVLLGAMHEDNDMHYTPLGKMAGVKLLAYSVETAAQKKEVRHLPIAMVLPLSFLLVMLTMWLKENYKLLIKTSIKSDLLQALLTSSYVMSIITFLWMSLQMGGAYLLFYVTGYDFNLGLTLSTSAFIGTASGFYITCLNHYKSVGK
ncbi:MAG: CHASE2 domain-containing protein [Bacteroidaceae bacterium]|nr:CHASE2 domain-containing protein [Bacteroidaceae bacterium]